MPFVDDNKGETYLCIYPVLGITQCGIPAGQSFVYNFTVEQFGTYWYHSHMSSQYADGVLGPIIIHAPEEAEARKLYDEDQVVLIQDWYHDLSSVNLETYLASDNENTEPIPDNGLINGMAWYVLLWANLPVWNKRVTDRLSGLTALCMGQTPIVNVMIIARTMCSILKP